MLQAFNTLHMMHHEATACHVTDEIILVLGLVTQILTTARKCIAEKKSLSSMLLT